MSSCIFPGSFDPLTVGHLDLIQRCARMFDGVVVAVMCNPEKRSAFSPEERVDMIRRCVRGRKNVSVIHSEGLTIDAARREGVQVMVRGVRNEVDFGMEVQLATINRHLSQGMETLLLPTLPQYAWVSSSIVREAAQYGGRIEGLVPGEILEDVRKRFAR